MRLVLQRDLGLQVVQDLHGVGELVGVVEVEVVQLAGVEPLGLRVRDVLLRVGPEPAHVLLRRDRQQARLHVRYLVDVSLQERDDLAVHGHLRRAELVPDSQELVDQLVLERQRAVDEDLVRVLAVDETSLVGQRNGVEQHVFARRPGLQLGNAHARRQALARQRQRLAEGPTLLP